MGERRSAAAGTVVLLSIISVASKMLGFVREQIIASNFGVSAVTDAYVSAQLLPALIDAVIGGAVVASLVPLFTDVRAQGKPAVARLLFTITVCLGVVYLGEVTILVLGAPAIMNLLVPGLDTDALARAVHLVRIFAPSILLLGLSGMYTALLTVYKRFLVSGCAALLANGAVLIVALVMRERITVEQIAWALVVGFCVQLLLILADMRRTAISSFLAQLDLASLKKLGILALPLTLANGITYVIPLIDKFFASQMGEGSIAALNYALRLVQLPVSVMVVGLSTVLFARFSQMWVEGENDALASEVGRTVSLIVFLVLPVAGLMGVLAEPVVATAFQRGNFDQQAVALTSRALMFYVFGLVPMATLPVLTKALYSIRNTRAHLTAGLWGAVTYLVAAVALRSVMAHTGLALAYSLGQVATFGAIYYSLGGTLGRSLYEIPLRGLPTMLLATAAAVASAWAVTRFADAPLPRFVLGAAVGGAVYMGIHVVLQSQESGWILSGAKSSAKVVANRILHR